MSSILTNIVWNKDKIYIRNNKLFKFYSKVKFFLFDILILILYINLKMKENWILGLRLFNDYICYLNLILIVLNLFIWIIFSYIELLMKTSTIKTFIKRGYGQCLTMVIIKIIPNLFLYLIFICYFYLILLRQNVFT